MPRQSELADAIASFTLKLELVIGDLAAVRLEEALTRIGLMTPHAAESVARRRATRPRVVKPPPSPSRPVVQLPQAKTATVIPAHVKITKLPPGPVPRQRRTFSALRSACRVPGCLEKNSGPRYDLMCRSHYATFNAAERQKFKAMWKATHSGA